LDNVDYGLGVIRTESSFATTIIEGSVATGSAIKIEEGVYFIRGFFVDVFPQAVILDQYSNTPSVIELDYLFLKILLYHLSQIKTYLIMQEDFQTLLLQEQID
jgi:hypothetical protein